MTAAGPVGSTPPGKATPVDRAFMVRALVLAARGEGKVEPNPPVGAVVVGADRRVLGEGWHAVFGGPHAEVVALGEAARTFGQDALRGSTLYVSLEPCRHTGKTPPCTEAIKAAGVRRVVVGCADPNPVTGGQGFAELVAAGIEVLSGVEGARARSLIAPFARWIRTRRPWVTAKWAMSLDGRIATASGESQWISCEESRREVHILRSKVGAVLVGLGTVLADDPRLTCRLEGGRNPRRVVLDSRAEIPLKAKLAAGAAEAPVWVAVTEAAPGERISALEALGVRVVRAGPGPRVDLDAVLAALGEDGVTHLLVEGGGRVLGSFFDRGLVDRVLVYVAPVVLGGEGAPGPVTGPVLGLGALHLRDALRLADVQYQKCGTDLVIEAWREIPE